MATPWCHVTPEGVNWPIAGHALSRLDLWALLGCLAVAHCTLCGDEGGGALNLLGDSQPWSSLVFPRANLQQCLGSLSSHGSLLEGKGKGYIAVPAAGAA
eukprot:1143485-Pelagomonas_calceolata.AAC.2